MHCLKTIVSAITPDCFTPAPSKSRLLLNRISYHQCASIPIEDGNKSPDEMSVSSSPISDSLDSAEESDNGPVNEEIEVNIPQEVYKCVESFAEHCHNDWFFEKQQHEKWTYGPKYDATNQKDPNLRPFSKLDEMNQVLLLAVIEKCIKELLLWGYVFTHRKPMAQDSLLVKQQIICVRTPRKKGTQMTEEQEYARFTPTVIDLEKIEFKNIENYKVIAETNAIVLNDLLHVCGAGQDPSRYNPLKFLYNGEGYTETCSFITQMLKYFHIKGFVCNGAFIALPGHFLMKNMTYNCVKYAPFGQQLFEMFLNSMDSFCQGDCSYQGILYPIIHHYLECHASYFNPQADCRETTQLYATTGEKIQIAKMLSRFHHFFKQCINYFLLTPGKFGESSFKTPTVASLKDFNDATLTETKSFSLVLLKALDLREKEVMTEICKFVQLACEMLKDLPSFLERKASNQTSLLDMKYLIYCFYCLVPLLTNLFQQLCEFKGSKDHFAAVFTYSSSIFNSLHLSSSTNTEVLIEFNVLTTFGQCLAALCAFSAFHTCEIGVCNADAEEMLGKLKWAAAKRLSNSATAYVGSVIVPLLTSMLHSGLFKDTKKVSKFFKLALRLAHEYLGNDNAEWIYTLCESLGFVAHACPDSVFATHILPLTLSLSDNSKALNQTEQFLLSCISVAEIEVQYRQRLHNENLKVFCRDVTAFMFFILKFLLSHNMNLEQCVGKKVLHDFVVCVTIILDYYYSSRRFTLMLDSLKNKLQVSLFSKSRDPLNTLLLCADTLIKCLPPFIQKMIGQVQSMFSDEDKALGAIESHIAQAMEENESFKIYMNELHGSIQGDHTTIMKKRMESQTSERTTRLLAYTKHHISQHQQSSSASVIRGRWKTLITRQKREAILRCLKSVPFYKLKRHRAVNLFLNEYSKAWLYKCKQSNLERLCERLLNQEDYEMAICQKISKIYAHKYDPLSVLFFMFSMLASTQQWNSVNGPLYEAYCSAIVQTTKWVVEEDEECEGESAAKAYEHFHHRLAQVTHKQKQLVQRKVPAMMLSVLGASEGEMTPLIHVTIQLGLVLLEGGNTEVQKLMLKELNSMDADVVTSIKDLVSSCCVLDWTSYERNYMSSGHDCSIATKVFTSSNQVIDLFRFLQLLCEGHNEEFQNYLRTQDRTTTSVNIVVATVDYLLKLQESIRDFYWHHAHHESLEIHARECFLVSFKVTRQVFRTLTEYIQGPCVGNQQALSHSRLWDAVSGYLHVFTSLQQKLIAHTNHMELLREVLDLEEEFFILLLSMLEGTTMSSSIGQDMLHMLLECEQYIESMIKFYHVFMKLSDATTSDAFKEYDLDKDGFISYREFEKAMNLQQHYTKEEIDYLMQLADTNKDGLLDYKEFTSRFHQPANNLGFHLCALIQQLSDILPNNSDVEKLTYLAKDLFDHFKGRMGCVEIIGKSSRVERVYFKIKGSTSKQWNDLAIKELRKNFIYNVELASQREKLHGFVNFCENTIFEMNYNDTLAGVDKDEELKRAEMHRSTNFSAATMTNSTIDAGGYFKATIASLKVKNPKHVLLRMQSLLSFIWILFNIIIKPVLNFGHFVKIQVAFLWHKGEGRLRPRLFRSLSRHMIFKRSNFSSSYLPQIAYSFASIDFILANSYYKIKKMLLLTTLLLNVLILVSIEDYSHHHHVYVSNKETGVRDMFHDVLRWLTYIHFSLSFTLILSSWNRKGQLILFKEEKKTARRLEQQKVFAGPQCGLRCMDYLIVKSPSFPRYFWDKQVKERVLNRIKADKKDTAHSMLGMKVWSKFQEKTKQEQLKSIFYDIIDARYQLWRLLVVIQEPQILYHLIYCVLSFAGLQWNVFYFSIHLIDLIFQSKVLVTVLKSLHLNSKQLMMTLAMTCVVLYIYAVIGFNFFRKFYQYELSGGEIQDNCDSMWNCFFFHLDKGLRSGGGIADVLVSAVGDQQYLMRLSFDMTFFFIVIVILLAVFQGLIIDAFGELRKKQDSVTEELQNKCFICGISKNEFSSVQEFDTHIKQHHSIRNYIFFLMHLIGKPETEFTGQESHVWEHYVQQQWTFFPSGTCFQIQEKNILLGKENENQKHLQTLTATSTSNESARKKAILHHSRTTII